MDNQMLIDEICRRVMSKVQETGKKKKILFLEEAANPCRELLEQGLKGEAYEIVEMKQELMSASFEDYQIIISAGISVNSMVKAAHGIADNYFLEILSKAILSGRTVYIMKEFIELLNYRRYANQNYYSMMEQNLNRLVSFGMTIAELPELLKILTQQDRLIQQNQEKDESKTSLQKGAQLDKKIITEADLRNISAEKMSVVRIRNNAVLSDLAKDYVHKYHIFLERNPNMGKKVSE